MTEQADERARVLRLIDDALRQIGGEAQTALEIIRDQVESGADAPTKGAEK